MNLKHYLLLGLSIFCVLFTSCETEVEVNDDFEPVPVVFGLLNPKQTNHIIRINRTYLGGNALDGALVPDSSQYTNISPVIEEVLNGNVSNTYNLTKTTIADKDENGVFFTTPNVAYTFTATLRTDALYRLRFSVGGKEVLAETNLAKDISFETVFVNRPNLNFASADPTLNPGSTPYLNVSSGFNYDEESVTRVEAIASLNFTEKRTDGSLVKRSISLKTNTISFIKDNSTEEKFTINTQQFLNKVGTVLSTEDNSLVEQRQLEGVTMELIGGNEDLDIYIQIGESTGGISQEKPEFTNVFFGDDNGIGLLASKVNVIIDKEITVNSEKLIVLAPETAPYKFCSTNPILSGDPRFECD